MLNGRPPYVHGKGQAPKDLLYVDDAAEAVLRVDSAGAAHELLDWCREGQIRFSVGLDLTETVRAASLKIPDENWVAALDQDGTERPNGQVAEITTCSTCPPGRPGRA